MAGYPVPGYPHLLTERPQGGPGDLAAGRVDVKDVAPALLAALDQFGAKVGQAVTIFSGYRTDAYSAQVGGFAGDPHTRRAAVDANVGGRPIGSLPGAVAELASLGLTSGNQPNFYQGRPDPAHVQLSTNSTSTGTGTKPSSSGSYSFQQLEALWTGAGGKKALAPVMAAIALAESGGNPKALNDNPTTGDYSVGLWQINYYGDLRTPRTRDFGSPQQLLASPQLQARAAVGVSGNDWSGLRNWSTYTNEKYLPFLVAGSNVGDTSVSNVPVVGGAVDAAGSVGDFLGRLADPNLWLRVLQILGGAALAGMGLFLLARQVALATDVPLPGPLRQTAESVG